MTATHDVVVLATGPAMEMNLLQGELMEAGIHGRVVGEDLSAGLGSLLPASVELWINAADEEQARLYLAERKTRTEPPETGAVVMPPMDGSKPVPYGDLHVEQFMVATDTGGGD